jgi:PAS domain S-box-containing protein
MWAIIQDITKRKKAEEALCESEKKYRDIIDNSIEGIFQAAPDGRYCRVNPSLAHIFGYSSPEDMVSAVTYIDSQNMNQTLLNQLIKQISEIRIIEHFEMKAYRKNGSLIWILLNAYGVKDDSGKLISVEGSILDITKRKMMEEELKKHRDHLESMVEERTRDLQDMNTALKVMLSKRGEDKDDVEQNIILNIKTSVFPYLKKLKSSGLREDQLWYYYQIESHLKDITSPFIKDLSSKYLDLSPSEIQVAYLIKEGKSSKDIAKILNISIHTVTTHRYRIRKKIDMMGHKNLKTYLQYLK